MLKKILLLTATTVSVYASSFQSVSVEGVVRRTAAGSAATRTPSELESLKVEHTRLQASFDELQAVNTALQSDNESMREHNKSMAQMYGADRRKVTDLTTETDRLKRALSEMTSFHNEAARNYTESVIRADALEKQLAQLRAGEATQLLTEAESAARNTLNTQAFEGSLDMALAFNTAGLELVNREHSQRLASSKAAQEKVFTDFLDATLAGINAVVGKGNGATKVPYSTAVITQESQEGVNIAR